MTMLSVDEVSMDHVVELWLVGPVDVSDDWQASSESSRFLVA